MPSPQALEDIILARPHFFRRIDDEENGIDFLERPLGSLHHVLAELMLRLVDARRVEEDNLRLGPRQNAEDAVARRLRLVTHDGDLLPNQAVDQR